MINMLQSGEGALVGSTAKALCGSVQGGFGSSAMTEDVEP